MPAVNCTSKVVYFWLLLPGRRPERLYERALNVTTGIVWDICNFFRPRGACCYAVTGHDQVLELFAAKNIYGRNILALAAVNGNRDAFDAVARRVDSKLTDQQVVPCTCCTDHAVDRYAAQEETQSIRVSRFCFVAYCKHTRQCQIMVSPCLIPHAPGTRVLCASGG